MFFSAREDGPLSILSEHFRSISHDVKSFMTHGMYGSMETQRNNMYWKKLEDSLLHIDFGLMVTNLPCIDAESLLMPSGCLY